MDVHWWPKDHLSMLDLSSGLKTRKAERDTSLLAALGSCFLPH